MDKTRVENVLIELLIKLQCFLSEGPVEITRATMPLVDLVFFDSLLGLEMTVALEEKLGIDISEQTVFSDRNTRGPLSVAQIADMVFEKYSGAAV